MTATANNRLGKQLRKLRTDRGWSLNFVADQFGVDKGVLSRVERGSMPSLKTLDKLRRAYLVDDQTFLGWVDQLDSDRAGAA